MAEEKNRMELRHLRYFVAVAEARSLTLAAERVLHTTQPSLSRQIRDLEDEVGAPLFRRNSRGLELTPAGETFLGYARAILAQTADAVEAARRVARPAKPRFSLGFLTGHEVDWLPEAVRALHDELPEVDVMISSQISPELARGLLAGTLDAAFMRREGEVTGVAYKRVVSEPLELFMPGDHLLAKRKTVPPALLAGQPFLNMSPTAPALRKVIDAYLRRHKLQVGPTLDVDHLAMAMSLIASTGSVVLLPVYARHFVTGSITSRPMQGTPPAIDLVVGFRQGDTSPVLTAFLRRLDAMMQRVAGKS